MIDSWVKVICDVLENDAIWKKVINTQKPNIQQYFSLINNDFERPLST